MFLQSFVNAQVSRDSAISIRINKDDVSNRIDWISSDQDSLAFAKPDYNDKNWKKFQFSFLKNSSEKVYWLRSYIKIDSHLINQPLQIDVMQLGASEIFLDGRRIATIGELYDTPERNRIFKHIRFSNRTNLTLKNQKSLNYPYSR